MIDWDLVNTWLQKQSQNETIDKLNNYNIQNFTGCDFNHWTDITGLYSPKIGIELIPKNLISLSGDFPVLYLSARNSNVSIEINFDLQSKKIYVLFFQIRETRNSTGRLIFQQHIDNAIQNGFTLLECRASDGEGERDLNGYITWAKFGFTMKEKSHNQFIKLMKGMNRDERCLQTLIKKDERVWVENKFSWNAEFKLDKSQINYRIFNIYLKMKEK